MVTRPRSRSLPILPSQISQMDSMDPNGDFQFLMELMSEGSVYEPSSSDGDSEAERGPLKVQIYNLTAKVYLDCSIEELVPARYVRDAEKSRMESVSDIWKVLDLYLPRGFPQLLSNGMSGCFDMVVKTLAIWTWKCGPTRISATEESSKPSGKCHRLIRTCTMAAAYLDSTNCLINPQLPRVKFYMHFSMRSWT